MRFLAVTLFVLALGLIPNVCGGAERPAPVEQVKTAFLYQFTKYIEWPALPETFTIAVAGESRMWPYLQELARQKKIKERSIRLAPLALTEDLAQVQVLVVGDMTEEALLSLMQRTGRFPLLTVGHLEGILGRGMTINFFETSDGKLRFEINRRLAEAAGLTLSSQLLKMARIIE